MSKFHVANLKYRQRAEQRLYSKEKTKTAARHVRGTTHSLGSMWASASANRKYSASSACK